jgi:hypothetical protein
MRIRHPLNLIPLRLLAVVAFLWGLTTPGITPPPAVSVATDVTSRRAIFMPMSHPQMREQNRNTPSSATTSPPRDDPRGDPFGALPSIEAIDAWIAELDPEVKLLPARVLELEAPRDEPREEPAAPAPTTPSPPVDPIAVGPVEEIICAWFDTPTTCDQARRVAHCESTLRPDAISPGGGNWGLFQINTVHRARVAAHGYAWEQILDPHVNTEIAHALWSEQGWRPWTCARNLGIR